MSLEKFTKETGYYPTHYLGDWKGYKVHEPDLYLGDEPIYIGYPLVVLEKDNKFRISEPEESIEIMKALRPEDDDEDEE